MVDPSGGRFTYLYDEVDRLKSMQVPTGQRYTQQYPSCLRTGSADSRRTTLLLGLGSKRRYEYDSVGRVTTQIEFDSSNQRIYTMVDSYDAVGNRTGRNTNGNPTTWLYDPSTGAGRRQVRGSRRLRTSSAYRLIGQQKSGQTATFVYDANSNLTTKWHQGPPGPPKEPCNFKALGREESTRSISYGNGRVESRASITIALKPWGIGISATLPTTVVTRLVIMLEDVWKCTCDNQGRMAWVRIKQRKCSKDCERTGL